MSQGGPRSVAANEVEGSVSVKCGCEGACVGVNGSKPSFEVNSWFGC